MPIPIYQPVGRQPIPSSKAYVPPVGERWQLQERNRRSLRAMEGIFSIAEIGLQMADFAIQQRQEVLAAGRSSELSRHTMESVKEFVDFRARLDQEELPENFLDTIHLLSEKQLKADMGNYGRYYTSMLEQQHAEVSHRHKKQIVDPVVRQRYEQWLNDYMSSVYGDYLLAGLRRDANKAIADTNEALQLAVDQGRPEMVKAILEAASKGANPVILPQQAAALKEQLIDQIVLSKLREKVLDMPTQDTVVWLETASLEDISVEAFLGNHYRLSEDSRKRLVAEVKSRAALLLAQQEQAKNESRSKALWLVEDILRGKTEEGKAPEQLSYEILRTDPRFKDLRREDVVDIADTLDRQAEAVRKEQEAIAARLKKEQEELERKQRWSAQYQQAFSMLKAGTLSGPIIYDKMRWPDLTDGERDDLYKLMGDMEQERTKAAKELADKKPAILLTDPLIEREVIKRFYDTERYGTQDVRLFVLQNHGPDPQGKPRLGNDRVTYWLDKLASRKAYVTEKLAVDMISGFYDNVLQYEESEGRILEMRTEEAQVLKQLSDVIGKGELTDKGLLEYAINLLASSKQRQVSRAVQRLAVAEPERKQVSAEDRYRQEMSDRFTEWKGSPPAQVGTIYGEIAFFDGTYWYRYTRRTWQRWDGEKWVTTK